MFTQLKKINYKPLKNSYIRKTNKYKKEFPLITYKLCILSLIFPSFPCFSENNNNDNDWLKLKDGLIYKQFKDKNINPFAKIHVLDINLKKIKLSFCPIDKTMTALESALYSKASVVFNGAFFSPAYQTIGLRISNGITTSKYKKISWWRIFAIKNNRAFIQKFHKIKKIHNLSFAIQSGPALIENNKIKNLKKSYASRTAIGIKKNGHLIVVLTENTQVTTKFLAKFMKNKLKCLNALNLDGGGSTQLSINLPNYNYQVIGLTKLPDPICLF